MSDRQIIDALRRLDRPVQMPRGFDNELLGRLAEGEMGRAVRPLTPPAGAPSSPSRLPGGWRIAAVSAGAVLVAGLVFATLIPPRAPTDSLPPSGGVPSSTSSSTTAASTTTSAPTSSSSAPTTAPPATTTTRLPVPEVPGWTLLDPGPLASGSGGRSAWTGDELVVVATTGVAAYDPGNARWRTLPDLPISWTERSRVVANGETIAAVNDEGDVAILNLPSGQWQLTTTPAPDMRSVLDAAWGDDRLFVLGDALARPVFNFDLRMAMYDPASEGWTTVSAPPIPLRDAHLAWTGSQLVMYGGHISGTDNRPLDPSGSATGAVYDPAGDTWEVLPTSGLSPNALTALWSGTELIVWDYLNQASAWSPGTGWTPLSNAPLDNGECIPVSTWVAGRLFGIYCGQGAFLDPGGDSWTVIETPDTAATLAGLVRGWPVAAGGLVLIWDDELFWQVDPDRVEPIGR